jgi:hypothetical protein
MFKLHVRRIRVSMIIVVGVIALGLSLLAGLSMRARVSAAAPSAPFAVFTCTPTGVAVFTNRVHVRCSPAAPNNIAYFAYCSTKDSATANRFLSVFTTAKVTGKGVDIYYNTNDTSGTACGCGSSNCRVLTGAEVRP